MVRAMPSYPIRVLLALDIALNVILFGEFETISARLGRLMLTCERTRRLRMPVWWINHCVHSHIKPHYRLVANDNKEARHVAGPRPRH